MDKQTNNSTKTKKIATSHPRGKKGGMAVNPEIIGAMTGAAIGGLAGMILGSQKAREKLAVVRDRAVETAGDVIENIDIKTQDVQERADEVADEALNRTQKVKKIT